MELRQNTNWGRYLEKRGWVTEEADGCAIRIKKLGILGSIIKIQRPDNLPLEIIEKIANKHRALFTKVEPLNYGQVQTLKDYNFAPDNWPLNPSRTIVINIEKPYDELLKSFSKDTRQALSKSLNEKITTIVYNAEKSKDFGNGLQIFYDLFKQTAREKRFWIPPVSELLYKAKSFGKDCYLILAFQTDEKLETKTKILPLSGLFLLINEDTAYYHHAASLRLGHLVKSPYLCLWEAIKVAKVEGCKRIDLEGIFDPRFKSMFKSWLKFSTFKMKWGGEVVEYPGPYIKVYNPLLRLLFRLSE